MDLETNQWHKLWERDALLDSDYHPLGFGLDPHQLYFRADHEGQNAIFTIDTRDLTKPPVLKVSVPFYDIQGQLIYSESTREAIGVHHYIAAHGGLYWDGYFQGLQRKLDQLLPETKNRLISFSRDEQRYIVDAGGDMYPGRYYLGDRKNNRLESVLVKYPELESKVLSPKETVEIVTRDGLMIEAYLTIPVRQNKDVPLPSIVFPHGGPTSRDYDDFDYWTQFFASRGIVVMQPNFRGSSGYGHVFQLHEIANYGLTMQDDLTDVAQWLVAQGIGDPSRICIVGAGYGGYAALTGAFKTPDLYRCAISFAGISNLKRHLDRSRYFTNSKLSRKRLGGYGPQLKENSAYYQVDQIKIPILLVHGQKDVVVSPIQSKIMARVLKKAGNVYEYLELENGTHYLEEQPNRTQLFSAMDEFLARYLLVDL